MFSGFDEMSDRVMAYERVVIEQVHWFRQHKMNVVDRRLVSFDDLYAVGLTGVWRAVRLADRGYWREPENKDHGCGLIVTSVRGEMRDWLRFVRRRLNRACVNLKFRESRFTDSVPVPSLMEGIGCGAAVRVSVHEKR